MLQRLSYSFTCEGCIYTIETGWNIIYIQFLILDIKSNFKSHYFTKGLNRWVGLTFLPCLVRKIRWVCSSLDPCREYMPSVCLFSDACLFRSRYDTGWLSSSDSRAVELVASESAVDAMWTLLVRSESESYEYTSAETFLTLLRVGYSSEDKSPQNWTKFSANHSFSCSVKWYTCSKVFAKQ